MQKFPQFFILFFAFIINSAYSQNQPDDISNRFTEPVDIPVLLSGNYGEIRSTGFHAGIDIKTQQVEGKNVLAADDGYVFRVAVQPGSYGKAIYLKHANGLITVYGHFSKFEPVLDKYVRDQQYLKKSFRVDLYPEAGQFSFKKGDLLGFSGNTGNSGGPHLHFEIRDKTATIPVNALNYGFNIADNIRPVINWLAVYPLGETSMVNGTDKKIIVNVEGSRSNGVVKPQTIFVKGDIGLGIETFDYLDNSANKCTPYTIELLIDNRQLFFCRFDSIPFSMMSYVKSHIDYAEKMKTGKVIHKLFLDPNNNLKIYKKADNRGVISFNDILIHHAVIKVTDTYGNQSSLSFDLQNNNEMEVPGYHPDTNVVAHFRYNKVNTYENNMLRVVIPENALFTDIEFEYKHLESLNGIQDVFQVHNEFTPLLKSYILSIKPVHISTEYLNKAYVAGLDSDNAFVGYGGDYHNGYVTAELRSFGKFFIALDTIRPVIKPAYFKYGASYTGNERISFKITDAESGIRNYSGYIDNRWALFEYDAKNDLLFYEIDAERLERNSLHTVEIIVTDNKDNTSHYSGEFRF